MLESPLYSGFISMLRRNTPFEDQEDVEEQLRDGIQKESLAARETGPYTTFDWSPILNPSPNSRLHAIAAAYPINPQLHQVLFYAMSNAKSFLSRQLLYPDFSTKTLGYKSARNTQAIASLYGEGGMCIDGNASTKDLETLYHRHGVKVEGETEIRWAWKFNDLKPRVYYARGASVYYPSRYIQVIFNAFVDSLEATNRFSRYHHSALTFPADSDAFIYDYSSFTSKLETIKEFTLAIADFCKGTHVRIVDTFMGIRRVDLGEMIEEYFHACCNFPPIDFGKLEGLPFSDEFLSQHTCGMLGVPGNISSSTLLHGIHLIIIMQTFAVKCVGDDAFAAGYIVDKADLASMLQNIGDISIEKMDFWMHETQAEREDEERDIETGWNYCKRPIDRLPTRLVVGEQDIFPPIAVFAQWEDSFHTTFKDRDTRKFLRKCANQLISFCRQFSGRLLEDEDYGFLNWVLRRYLHESGIERNGIPHKLANGLVYPHYISSQGFFEDMIESHWNSIVRVPLPNDYTSFDQDIRTDGPSFIRITPAVTLARNLQYAVVEPLFHSFVVRDDPTLFERFIMKDRYQSVTQVDIQPSIPSWLLDLINAEQLGREAVSDLEDVYDHEDDLLDMDL